MAQLQSMDKQISSKVDFNSPALESLKASDLKIRNEQPRGRLGNFGKLNLAAGQDPRGGKSGKKEIMTVNKKPSQSSVISYKGNPDSTHESSLLAMQAKDDGPDGFTSVSSYNTGTKPAFSTPHKKSEQGHHLGTPAPNAIKSLT